MNTSQTSSILLQTPIPTSIQSIQPSHFDPATHSFIPIQDCSRLPPQPFLSKRWIASKCGATRFTSTVYHLFTNVREVTIGIGSLSVMFNTASPEHSCYLEFVPIKDCWRVSHCPSDIPLRAVECTELSPGCRELINIAGCVFKTRESTPQQDCKPIETRSLGSVMRSLGFCPTASGTSYRVYVSRMGRPYFIVTVFVNHIHGETEPSNGNIGHALMTDVNVLERESVPAVVHRLKVLDMNYAITLHRRKIVREKFKGNNSIVMV